MEEEVPFLKDDLYNSDNVPPRRRDLLSRPALPWALVALLSLYTLISSLQAYIKSTQWNTTDFIPSRPALKPQRVKFTSSLDFTDPAHIYRIFDSSAPKYIGNASAEIDQAWEELISPADIYITDGEAKAVGGELYRNPRTGRYKIELEVFHSLHCLNMIRKRVYSDSSLEMLTRNAVIHVDHCIESLRELIMCNGNMTPIPIEWSEKGERINPNYATVHSCRNFGALKDWVRGRTETVLS